MARMKTQVRAESQEPLTFHNAPTEERNGVVFVEQNAAIELARRIAIRDASLLERLAAE